MYLLRFIILTFFTISLLAFNGGPIPEKVIKKAERKYGGSVVSRFVEYNSLLQNSKHFSLHQKLKAVNDFFNKVPFKSDIKNWKREDYWATPLEFLSRYKGDSEDYVIAKYFALKTMGIDTKKLYFTYVDSKKSKEAHMILSYFKSPDAEPFILDNLNPELLTASQRDDLTPIYNFNPSTPSQDEDQASTHKNWEKLYKRVQRNKL